MSDRQLYRIDYGMTGKIDRINISGLMRNNVLVPVEAEVVTTVAADVEYDNPDQGDQRYSIHVDGLPYPGEYQVVSVYNSEGYEEAG